MIVLDTHIWYWWVANHPRLTARHREIIQAEQPGGLGVSIMSCWELAKKTELGKLELDRPVRQWIDLALTYDAVQLLPLTPLIVIESTNLPGAFHRDPVDQLIVATARVLDCPVLTADGKILAYEHVKKLT